MPNSSDGNGFQGRKGFSVWRPLKNHFLFSRDIFEIGMGHKAKQDAVLFRRGDQVSCGVQHTASSSLDCWPSWMMLARDTLLAESRNQGA